MIKAQSLTRRYGKTLAVDDLSFTVHPGVVTGFLGPNGAGKSTTMRMIVGLDRPTSGSVTVNGRPFERSPAPLHEVGALLEAGARNPGITAYKHLLILAQTHGISKQRVRHVLELVGLSEVAGKKTGTFSLGMGQRLGIAAALLGDPETVLLDEPVNGLDPEGIRWVRQIARQLADENKTVLISSHLMSEMALTADRVIVIGRGRLIADAGIDEFVAQATGASVIVRSPQLPELARQLRDAGAEVTIEDEQLVVRDLEMPRIGDIAAESGISLHELSSREVSLEDAFMEATGEAVEFRSELLDEGESS